MPKLDLGSIPVLTGTGYLEPYRAQVAGRSRLAIAEAGGLTDFGASLCTLAPGAWSSQRHWHSAEDELVVVLSGELTLVTDAGAEPLRPGDCATFAKGVADGHHLQNRSSAPATFLAVGGNLPDEDECHYPDIDQFYSTATGFVRKSERP
ncbi:MAG TPA: cupin domain-containing protein [Labilithrix sp.]|nr:cupin domain-containing protein [Labilithrix sp.]